MRRMSIIVAASIVALAGAAPASAQVDYRQWNQQARIRQGYRSGELTNHEARRLEWQQHRIARYEARSRWDGGGLSGHERARIARMQTRASANIYHQKHDWQDRGRRW